MIPKRDNYAIQADFARRLFLERDQRAILAKSPVESDGAYLYLKILDRLCRIDRKTGLHAWQEASVWVPSLSHSETLTIFDYLCDARPDRSLSGAYTPVTNLGHMFHTSLTESETPTALEQAIDKNPDAFCRACIDLGGTAHPGGDVGFALPFFPDLPVVVRFWHSDEDFGPQLRLFWDENTLQYLRYETTFYARDMLLRRLAHRMKAC